jgi:hypothetical protein
MGWGWGWENGGKVRMNVHVSIGQTNMMVVWASGQGRRTHAVSTILKKAKVWAV